MEIIKQGRVTTYYCNRHGRPIVEKTVQIVDEIKRDDDPVWKKKEVKYGRN